MISFKTFLEKNVSNPLRKQELQSQGVAPHTDPATFRDKIPSAEYEMLLDRYGVKFFMPKDEYRALDKVRRANITRILNQSVNDFLNRIRDILPNRKPRIVIKDIAKVFPSNPYQEDGQTPPAYKSDNIIYIDPQYIDNVDYMIHEYAHYLADKVPNQSFPILQREYKAMLDNYFRSVKKKQRQDLSLPEDQKLREKIAKKLGLPSQYAFVNPDEFFAEIITNWKTIPNNAATYKFKQAVKQVLSRV